MLLRPSHSHHSRPHDLHRHRERHRSHLPACRRRCGIIPGGSSLRRKWHKSGDPLECVYRDGSGWHVINAVANANFHAGRCADTCPIAITDCRASRTAHGVAEPCVSDNPNRVTNPDANS
jgi:hypothetical protein